MNRFTHFAILFPLVSFGACHAGPDCRRALSGLAVPSTTWNVHRLILDHEGTACNAGEAVGELLPSMLLDASDFQVLKSEASLAAEMHLSSTVPALLKLLERENRNSWGISGFTSETHLDGDPVAKALWRLKVPASALAGPLQSRTRSTRERVILLLLRINTMEAREMLTDQAKVETDPNLRNWLNANISAWAHEAGNPKD